MKNVILLLCILMTLGLSTTVQGREVPIYITVTNAAGLYYTRHVTLAISEPVMDVTSSDQVWNVVGQINLFRLALLDYDDIGGERPIAPPFLMNGDTLDHGLAWEKVEQLNLFRWRLVDYEEIGGVRPELPSGILR